MRTKIEVLEQLLAEIVIACEENNISLFAVTTDSVRLVERKLKSKSVYAVDYAVYADDYDILMNVLQSKQSRMVESLYNNPHMPGTALRYSDDTTLLYDPIESGSFLCNGVHINIWPLIRRPSKGLRDKLINLKERLCEEKENVRIKDYTLSTAFRQKAIELLWRISGQKRVSRKLLKAIIHRSNSMKGSYTFHLPNSSIIRISNKEIKELPHVTYGTYKIKVFTSETKIGRKYNKKRRIANEYTLMSTYISWTEYVRRTDPAALPQRRKMLKLMRAREKNYLKQLREMREYWYLLQLSYERMMYNDIYCAHKEEYIELYRCKDFDTLSRNLNDYVSALLAFAKKKLALCFDVDLFEMALAVIIMQGKYRLAERILNYVKLEHLENVEEYLKRQETGENLDLTECRKRFEALRLTIDKITKENIDRFVEIETGTESKASTEVEPESDEDTESVLEKRKPVVVRECAEGTEIHVIAKNRRCKKVNKGLAGCQTIRMSNASHIKLNEDVEYNDIRFIIDETIKCPEFWSDVMDYMQHLSEEKESVGVLSYENADYFYKKLILCSIMNKSLNGGDVNE